MNYPHDLIRQQMESTGHSPELDERLQLCPDPECHECGRIVCPWGEPLHFHHDGCPACDGPEVAKQCGYEGAGACLAGCTESPCLREITKS